MTIEYRTVNGTATNPKDYKSERGTLFIPANTLSGTIAIPIVNDNVQESTETFTVTLSAPINATIATPTGTVSILNGTGSAAKSSEAVVQNNLIKALEIQKLNVKVFPNPTNNHFNVIVQGAVKNPITLKIIDVAGRTIQSFNNINANTSIFVGTDYRPGVYILEVGDGNAMTGIQPGSEIN